MREEMRFDIFSRNEPKRDDFGNVVVWHGCFSTGRILSIMGFGFSGVFVVVLFMYPQFGNPNWLFENWDWLLGIFVGMVVGAIGIRKVSTGVEVRFMHKTKRVVWKRIGMFWTIITEFVPEDVVLIFYPRVVHGKVAWHGFSVAIMNKDDRFVTVAQDKNKESVRAYAENLQKETRIVLKELHKECEDPPEFNLLLKL
jgi:hypothetical protein